MMYYFPHMWGGNAWAILMWAGVIVFWVGVIVVVYLLVRNANARPSDRSSSGFETRPGESPRDILDRRYASGEIPKEEYDRILNDLRGGRAA